MAYRPVNEKTEEVINFFRTKKDNSVKTIMQEFNLTKQEVHTILDKYLKNK